MIKTETNKFHGLGSTRMVITHYLPNHREIKIIEYYKGNIDLINLENQTVGYSYFPKNHVYT